VVVTQQHQCIPPVESFEAASSSQLDGWPPSSNGDERGRSAANGNRAMYLDSQSASIQVSHVEWGESCQSSRTLLQRQLQTETSKAIN
jgi:hypothetical protein